MSRATVVMLSEVHAAGSLAPSDFLSGTDSCYLCGLTPADVCSPRRPNPSTALLEPAAPAEDDPMRRSRRRCRNREACARRQGMRR